MRRSAFRLIVLLLLAVLAGGRLCAQEIGAAVEVRGVPESELELLRSAEFAPPRRTPAKPYGIEPGRKTLSPLYHLTSGVMWVWENYVAPDVSSPGGYRDTNTDYFRALVVEYGGVAAIVCAADRVVRNTRIGRASTPTQPDGLITDDPKRYRP